MEERRAEARNGRHTPEQEYYDVMDDGTRVEVKTTQRIVKNPNYNRKGRYQLEGDNHQELVEQGGVYDFMLRDDDGEVVEVKTMEAASVDNLLVENDREWPTGSKLKIRWDVIHE